MTTKFTDRFIQLPIKVYDTNIKELTGRCNYEDSYLKLLPDEICEYKPAEDEDNDEECVHIKLKNGDAFYTYLTIEAFELLLNNHALQYNN